MTRALLWLFFLADLAGIAWAVRVLVREARRHLTWHLAQWRERRTPHVETIDLPPGFVVVPSAGRVPQQRTETVEPQTSTYSPPSQR